MLTDDEGRYCFITIKPGPYPWGNHEKAWCPAHIHFSLFGNVYAQRLVTQMYFPSDPLFDFDPIFQSVPDAAARQRLVSRFSIEKTVGGEMLGYEFDIVLRGRNATPMGAITRPAMTQLLSPSQTIGPFSHEAWRWACAASDTTTGAITINGVLRDGDGKPDNDGMIEAWSPSAAAAEESSALPGFRRVPTDDAGGFTLRLARPAPGEPAALVTIFARGLVLHQFTAVFLEDDEGLESSDILRQVSADRRATLIASKTGATGYAWEINLQGVQETVFFDYE